MSLVDILIQEGWLKTPRIIEAFLSVKRKDFMPEDAKHLAEENIALPIGYGQTISQPLTVAFMMELLKPDFGDKILDIGSGSGWTSALLAHIVSGGGLKSKINPPTGGQKSKIAGKVIAIDRIPELVEFGKNNVAKYDFIKSGVVEFLRGDGSKGYRQEAPFDKILASASGRKISEEWKEQLKIGGRIVAPIGDSIRLFVKKSDKEFEEKEYPGFVFVPLISNGQ